jgi:hypothetical protein
MRLVNRPVARLVAAGMMVLPALCLGQATNSHAPPNTGHIKHIEGAVVRVDGNELLLKAKGGTTETYQLAPMVQLLRSRPGQLSDLGTGRFVGCTNLYGQSDRRVAEECHIFPEGMRGFAGDGSDADSANDAEISGTITEVRDAAGAVTGTAHRILIQILRKGGTATMAVSPVTVITVLSVGDAAALKPGATVRGMAQQAVDGTEVIQTLSVVSAGHG